MTKYRLKDAELQKKLDEISDGDFSRQIEGNLQNIKGYGVSDADYRLFFGELSGRYEIVNRFSMLLYEHEIEVIPEYDSIAWNDYPYIRPPEGVLMLVECIDENDKTFKTCAEYVEDGHGAYYWRNEYEIDVPVKRFRPLE